MAIATEDTAVNDHPLPGARPCDELRLIKTFLRLKDSTRRQKVIELAEQLADEAGSATAGPALAVTVTSFVDPARDILP